VKKVKEITYSELKQNYDEVLPFLQDYTLEYNVNNKTKIVADLQLWGDDNLDLLYKFVKKYHLDFSNFKYGDHFESEGEIFNILNGLWYLILGILNFLKFPMYFMILIFSKTVAKNLREFVFYTEEAHLERKDLTLADLVTCKVFGAFELRENIQFILVKSRT
jgi:hypothetical protein